MRRGKLAVGATVALAAAVALPGSAAAASVPGGHPNGRAKWGSYRLEVGETNTVWAPCSTAVAGQM